MFSQFFLLTLYMQQVLHYSAIQTGVAYLAFTLAIIAFSASRRRCRRGSGSARCVPAGLLIAGAALFITRGCRCDGHYFWDLFPAFIIGGIGLALDVRPDVDRRSGGGERGSDAGVASGLMNTTQQVGGAIGVAVATTVATTFTRHYLDAHSGATALSPAALTHGFQITFYVLGTITVAAAALAAILLETRPPVAQAEELSEEEVLDGLVPAPQAAA